MNKLLLSILCFTLMVPAFAGVGKDKEVELPKLENGMYVQFNTTKGIILCELEFEKAPMTVANFVGLAEGNFSVDTSNYDKPFYNGLKFHRVIADFMVQGGDPKGNGNGGPDHRMYDETRQDLRHNGPGILSMANSDPRNSKKPFSNAGKTNGSQFFITHKATPHLDGLHTVFGHVIVGQDVLNSIEKDDIMTEVIIIRKGKLAESFDATAVYKEESFYKTPEGQVVLIEKNEALLTVLNGQIETLEQESADQKKEKKKLKIDTQISALKLEASNLEMNQMNLIAVIDQNKKVKAEKERIAQCASMSEVDYNKFFLAEIQKLYPNAEQTASGLVYVLETTGDSTHVAPGLEIEAHCTGNFRKDGSKFFSTLDGTGEPMKFVYKVNRMVIGWEEGMAMLGAGGKATFFLPYHLAYGAKGRGAAIPPYSDLIFTTNILTVKAAVAHDEHDGHDHSGHSH
ncbi:MAG: peptidyl-prolyl cis-trans isomerase A (cyclophilin A) [Crocinitomix sp.]|jgi:peptidyl-prolyl cis-trans isomerase A (cyclophilin A)